MIGLPGKYRVSTAVPQGRGGGEQRIDQTHSGWGCNLYVRQAMSLNKFLQRENRGVWNNEDKSATKSFFWALILIRTLLSEFP